MTSRPRFRRFTRGWLFAKFVLFLLPILLMSSWIGLSTLVHQQRISGYSALIEYVDSQTKTTAAALTALDIDVHPEIARDLVSLMTSDQKFQCAEVIATQTQQSLIQFPAAIGCAHQPADALRSRMIGSAYSLKIGFNTESLRIAEENLYTTAFWVAFSGIVIRLVMSALGFQLMVSGPMRRLLQAIEKSAEDGRPALVVNNSRDEFGILTRAFNALQLAQEEDANRVRRTLNDLNDVYHTTPSLMFSLNGAGEIACMSTFWQETTGYSVKELIGKPLSAFLDERSAKTFHAQIMPQLTHTGHVRDILLRLKCKNSVEIDVLFSAAGSGANAGEVLPGPSAESDEGLFFCAMSDVTLLKKVERQLQQVSVTDHLTGLPNRADLSQYMNDIFARMPQHEERFAVLFIDLDNFKTINDTHGHLAGDRVLVEATRRLQKNVRGHDYIARLGGDEFAVICRNLSGDIGPELTASRLIDSLRAPIDIGIDGQLATISASIGIALISSHVESPQAALQMADIAMYEAKRQGRNNFAIYGRTTAKVHIRPTLAIHA